MDLGLYIAASGMVAEQTRQSQISNELANAATPGYKSERSPQHSFNEMLLHNTVNGQVIGSMQTGVRLEAPVTDLNPDPIQETGQPLDFAIEGQGFFAVQTPQGVRYTRDGQFTASARGQLVNAEGDPVLSQNGRPIAIGAEGRVQPGALGVFELQGATKQGDDLFQGRATGRGEGAVRAGALEESSVNPVTTMVEMMGSMRTFQSGQQAIQAIDETLGEAAGQVGQINSGS